MPQVTDKEMRRIRWLEWRSKITHFLLSHAWISTKKFLNETHIRCDAALLRIAWKYSAYNPFGSGKEAYKTLLRKAGITIAIIFTLFIWHKLRTRNWVTPAPSTYKYAPDSYRPNINYPRDLSETK